MTRFAEQAMKATSSSSRGAERRADLQTLRDLEMARALSCAAIDALGASGRPLRGCD